MAKPALNDVTYGHFGQATYNTEHGLWSFDRRPGHRGILHQLSSWKKALSSPYQADGTPQSEPRHAPRDVQLAAKSLGRNNAELIPSLDLLPALGLKSAVITETAATYDPAVGELLSFGSFTSERPKHGRFIAAVASGEAGNILRLIMLGRERYGWGPDKSIWLEKPSVIDGMSGYWVEDAAPIQQICFAQTEDRSAFLAVRFPSRTVVFRPLLRERPVPAIPNCLYALPASRIDPHHILSISLQKTGGFPHADITFNSDYQRQIGIVDQKGYWSIWDIEHGYKGESKHSLSPVTSGLIERADVDPEDEETQVREDDWARILWVGDVNTVLVCNRRRLEIYGLKGGQTVPLRCWQPVSQRSADWILDVKRHATNRHWFFVLTSTRLFFMAVTCQNDVLGNRDIEPGATMLMSWAHFRGSEDITLQLCVPTLSDEECRVLLFSHLNHLVTVFQFESNELDPSRPFSSSDPMSLDVGDLFGSTDAPLHITNLQLEQMQFRQDERLHSTGPGSAYMAKSIRFYRLSAMLSDLSIHQAVFYSPPVDTDNIQAAQVFVEAPSWNIVIQPFVGTRSTENIEQDDEFVIPDGLRSDAAPSLTSPYRLSSVFQGRKPSSTEITDRRDPQTLNYGFMYDAVVRGYHAARERNEGLPESEDISDLVDGVNDLLLRDLDPDSVPRGTMLELSQSTITVPDVDAASSQLQSLLSKEGPLSLQHIASGHVLHLAGVGDESPSISSLYDAILENWIAPLPTTISGRVRQSKERLARRIAADVMLASSRLRLQDPSEADLPESIKDSATLSQDSGISFPLQNRRGSLAPSDLALSSSQPTPASQPSTSTSPLFTTPQNPLTRLTKHLKITTPPPTLSPDIAQILMHWLPHADPSTYDWPATTRAINTHLGHDNDDATSDPESSQRSKERQKRKAERLAKRQKREQELRKGGVESQPLPLQLYGRDVGMRSSPVPVVGFAGAAGNSQMGMEGSQFVGGFVQSQVEPGRHGARLGKKKKKGRVSGF